MRKEIGFIKGSSRKQDFVYSNSEGESSDSFSSFDYDPRRDRQEEFSPYRHPDNMQKDSSYPSSRRVKGEQKGKDSLRSREPPHFSNLILRNNFVQTGKQVQEEDSSSSKEESMDPVIKVQAAKGKMQENERQYEEELSLSNIHKFQRVGRSEESRDPKGKIIKETINRKYLQEDYSSSSEEEDEEKIVNVHQKKSAVGRNRRPKQVQQQLITEYDKREFKDKTMKRAILEHQNQNRLQKRNILEAKGGICFQVDKTAFKGSPSQTTVYPKKRKIRDSDPRLELLQRRQNARNYDRQSRSHLFGYY